MYTPKYFKVTDVKEIWQFVQQNSFGTLVTTDQGKPIATHLPLQLVKEGENIYLTGHMAYGNPQWRTFESCDEVLAMFQGPHAYISSSWYKDENVPTWNYQAVHIYGKASILSGEALHQDLAKLMHKYERHRVNPVVWEQLSPELLERQLKGLVGFKIAVREIQAADKLSQNRTAEDYDHIVKKLYEEQTEEAQQLAQVMERKAKRDN